MDTTAHDLKILEICHYILGGIYGAMALFLLAYGAAIGFVMVHFPTSGDSQQALQGLPFFTWWLVCSPGCPYSASHTRDVLCSRAVFFRGEDTTDSVSESRASLVWYSLLGRCWRFSRSWF